MSIHQPGGGPRNASASSPGNSPACVPATLAARDSPVQTRAKQKYQYGIALSFIDSTWNQAPDMVQNEPGRLSQKQLHVQ